VGWGRGGGARGFSPFLSRSAADMTSASSSSCTGLSNLISFDLGINICSTCIRRTFCKDDAYTTIPQHCVCFSSHYVVRACKVWYSLHTNPQDEHVWWWGSRGGGGGFTVTVLPMSCSAVLSSCTERKVCDCEIAYHQWNSSSFSGLTMRQEVGRNLHGDGA